MPKVHFVKKARKDNPVCKAGESYYWWKFRYGGKRYSLTPPKRHQLTQSTFLQEIYQIEERYACGVTQYDAEDIAGILSGLRDDCQYSLDNMPEQLQNSSEAGMLLQERIDALDGWIDEIERIDWDDEEMTPEDAAEIIGAANPGF